MTDTTDQRPLDGPDAAAFFERGMAGDPGPGFRALAAADPAYLHAFQEYTAFVYGRRDRTLATQVRHLVVVALLAGTGEWAQMRVHTRRALLDGIAPAELLQALEYTAVARGTAAIVEGARIVAEEVAAYEGPGTVATRSSLTDAARVERNKETFRRLQYEVIVGGRDELIEEIFSPEFTTLRAGLADLAAASGRASYPSAGSVYDRFRAGLAGMKLALGDQEREIVELHGTGDLLWARFDIHAAHTGTFLGRPATGKAVTYTEVAFLRFDEDGRIAEGWFLCDEFNLAAQLGAAS
ncbi:ester cyclase [Streptomyces mirabilis]